MPHSVSQLKNSSTPYPLIHALQHGQINGYHFHPLAAGRDTPGPREDLSDEDEEESGQEEESDEVEMEEAPRKWQGIEAIFEAYHEYVDGESVSDRFSVCQWTPLFPLSSSCERGIRMNVISPRLWFLSAQNGV